MAPGPDFKQRATPSRRAVQWTSTVPYFSLTRLMQSPLLSLADNAVRGVLGTGQIEIIAVATA
jgi:hypothetical protein